MSSFFEKLEDRVSRVNSLLCVGLDPHLSELFPSAPPSSEEERCDAAFTFCKTLIDVTAPYTACYKPNVAFFEALGVNGGIATLKRVIDSIPDDIPVLLDVKRGDIGSTAAAYATACFDHLNADAVTLSPLMGWDSIEPFVTGEYSDKGAFLLCKTSNPGSNDLLALDQGSSTTLYETIAKLAGQWSFQHKASLGLVVGATDSIALSRARKAGGESVWILAPGVGAQGGDLELALASGLNSNGTGMLIPVSRGISRADNPGEAAEELQEKINTARSMQTNASVKETKDSLQAYQKDFLEFALAESVLKFGSFVLKSGRTSPYFFNAGLFASGAALHKLGKAYASAIMASPVLATNGTANFDVVFGPAYKGISLGALVCAALYHDFGVNVGFAYNRKEAKDHGEGGKLVGAPMEGKRVLVVDDVITAGTAIRESYDMLTAIGAKTTGVAIALDRAEKRSLDDPISAVQAVARDLEVPVVSIVNLPQLQLFLEKSNDYEESVLKSVSDYRAEYGV
jgi:orotidine 5'-phosphate decarboxylase subfamily 2